MTSFPKYSYNQFYTGGVNLKYGILMSKKMLHTAHSEICLCPLKNDPDQI